MSMFSRTSKGEQMVNDFRPLMQPAAVQTTADYYNNTFVKLRPIALAMNATTVATFTGYVKGLEAMQQDLAKMPPAQMQALAQAYPSMAAMLQNLPQMQKTMAGFTAMMAANVDTFKNVPPGLDHYKPLVTTMQANVDNYAAIDALPAMGLFPWFFIIPGLVFVAIAAYLFVGEINPEWVWPKLPTREPVAH
jgi:ABC-type transport system involved in multi-copper enzyme maturation permease subunit